MDIEAVRNGIVATIQTGVTSLTTGLPYAVNDGTPTLFYVARVLPVFDEAMGRGMDRVTATVKLLVDGTDEVEAQKLLDGYMAGSGAKSVKAAITADKTLNGSCHSARATDWANHGKHPLGSNEYWGAELTIDIYGGN